MTINVTALQHQLEAQTRTINALQNENHWLLDVIFNPSFNEIDMRLMVETTPRDIRMGLTSIKDAPERKVYYPDLAKKVYCSDKVASQRLRTLAKTAGVFSYRRAYDIDENGKSSENPRVFIKPTALTETPAQIELERAKRGGSTWQDGKRVKRCKNPECNSPNLVKVSQIICRDCGEVQDDKTYTPVNNVDDLAHDEAKCQDDTLPSEDETTDPDPDPTEITCQSDTDPEISKVPTMCINTVHVDMEAQESRSSSVQNLKQEQEQKKYPEKPKCHYDGLPPAFLRDQRIWCCGRLEWNEERQKWDKIPFIADMQGQKKASSTDPSTWRTYEHALAIFEKSQGWTQKNSPPFDCLMFMCNGTFTFLDQDSCRDLETGTYTSESLERARRIHSYTEPSISEDGLHTYAIAKLPPGRRRNDTLGIEMYDQARPCVYTGRHLEGFPIELERRQEEVAALHSEIFPPQPELLWDLPEGDGEEKSDEEIEQLLADVLQRIASAKNAEKILRLWNGDYSDYLTKGKPDHSRGDVALCCMLGFYVGKDVSTVDKLFRHSKMNRPKWEERADYRERTFRYAFGIQEEMAS